MSATSYIYLSNKKILTLLHRPPPNTPKELGSSRGWVGGVEGGIEMKPLGMEKKKKQGIIYTCKLWTVVFGPNWLNCKSFPHGPNSWTERLGLIMRPGTPAAPGCKDRIPRPTPTQLRGHYSSPLPPPPNPNPA